MAGPGLSSWPSLLLAALQVTGALWRTCCNLALLSLPPMWANLFAGGAQGVALGLTTPLPSQLLSPAPQDSLSPGQASTPANLMPGLAYLTTRVSRSPTGAISLCLPSSGLQPPTSPSADDTSRFAVELTAFPALQLQSFLPFPSLPGFPRASGSPSTHFSWASSVLKGILPDSQLPLAWSSSTSMLLTSGLDTMLDAAGVEQHPGLHPCGPSSDFPVVKPNNVLTLPHVPWEAVSLSESHCCVCWPPTHILSCSLSLPSRSIFSHWLSGASPPPTCLTAPEAVCL